MTAETKKPELVDLLDENFEDMVRSMANRYASNPANRDNPLINAEDLFGEGMLASVKAYEAFDPARGAAFRTYAYVYVTRAMWGYCNKYRFTLSSSATDRRDRLEDVRQANSGIANIENIDVAYQPVGQDAIDLNEYFLAGLDEVRRGIVIDRYIANMTLQEIADKYDMSPSGVQSTIKRLRDKLTRRARQYESSN